MLWTHSSRHYLTQPKQSHPFIAQWWTMLYKIFTVHRSSFQKPFQNKREVSCGHRLISQGTLWKLCEIDRKVPQQIGATHYPFRQPDSGFQNRNISHSFHFLGKVCNLDGRHMTVSKKVFSRCHAPCSAVGRFPEPFTRSLSVGDADTDRHIITIWGTWTAVRREKQRSRMQGCKNAKTKIFCILALLNKQHE